MRNREATHQICVNCQLNPPVDPEESEAMNSSPSSSSPSIPEQPTPPPIPAVTTPAPTAALPSLPPFPRSPSSQVNRVSVLDPVMEARKALRPVGNRNLGSSVPLPPSTPPPRSTTPQPPSTPPPTKNISGPLSAKNTIPRPLGPPPTLPLSPPPSANLVLPPPPPGSVQIVPRDMRRSPQSSLVLSGNILPPSSPPPPPPSSSAPSTISAPLSLPPTRPPPTPSSAPTTESEENKDTEQKTQLSEENATEAKESEPVPIAAAEEEPIEPTTEKQEDSEMELVEQEPAQEVKEEAVLETAQEPAQEQEQEQEQQQEQQQTIQAEGEGDEDDKTMESDDDFEDAEEEVYRPSEDEIKERESKRKQSDRASKLIGQKMLQGWTMLQDPCPNTSCHGVPLLRSREKKEYCVVCENYFQREQDLENGKYTIVSSETSAPSVAVVSESSDNNDKSNDIGTSSASPPQPALSSAPIPAQAISPTILPQPQNASNITVSPNIRAVSPMSSPLMGRSQRELLGRVSNSIILPPAGSPSFATASQQILGKHTSEDLDKLAAEDEDVRRHIQIIRKGGEYSNKSLPPVPGAPAPPAPPAPPAHPLPPPPVASYSNSRPISTYSNSSDHHEERQDIRRYQTQRHGSLHSLLPHSGNDNNNAPAPPPVPLSPEVQALVAATHKTIATILHKLEAYRLALEISESPKECQILTNQIKGLMECLKACRETL
ncbi:hypothetical protein BGZ46_001871 [Entomortierella lignicola]|nr:hypothetical protein BGZ46_001871 [Entomortierella lignicola]